jgi:hypothetical protein
MTLLRSVVIFFLCFLPFLSLGRGQPEVSLKGLDKVTGRVYDLKVPVGKPIHFGTLEITAHHVDQSLDTDVPETTVFLEIKESK